MASEQRRVLELQLAEQQLKASEERRQVELQLAEQRRVLELQLAEQQLKASEERRQLESQIADERRQLESRIAEQQIRASEERRQLESQLAEERRERAVLEERLRQSEERLHWRSVEGNSGTVNSRHRSSVHSPDLHAQVANSLGRRTQCKAEALGKHSDLCRQMLKKACLSHTRRQPRPQSGLMH
eukprot:tig00020685_g12950.t1